MRALVVLAAAVALASCAPEPIGHTEGAGKKFATYCIDGLTYVGWSIGGNAGVLSVKLDRDSHVIPCEESPL